MVLLAIDHIARFQGLEIGSVADCIMTAIALVVALFTFKEYRGQKALERYSVFSKYSERYTRDENIQVVTKYLIAFMNNQLDDNGVPLDADVQIPTIYQKEMFLRYFEELEMQLEKKRMTVGIVEDFFVYYAVAASMCKRFLEDTELESGTSRPDVWHRYRKLVLRYKYMEKGIQSDYIQSHGNGETISIEIDMPVDKRS